MATSTIDDWPELGQLIHAHRGEIMHAWEELIESRMPSCDRTTHRVAIRDHLPRFLEALARDLTVANRADNAESVPAARKHGLQRWQQGYELELVIRDYQLLFHAIVNVVGENLARKFTTNEISNLRKLLDESSLVAIQTFLMFNPDSQEGALSDEFGERVLESCSDAIIVTSLEGIILRWSEGARSLYGFTPEEIVGASFSTLVPVNRRLELERCFSSIRAGKEISPIDTVRNRADSTEISVSFAASPLRDREGRLVGIVSIERDISDRVRAAEALREALNEAERANRTKSEFLTNVSHELRTPMNAILGMTELALNEELSPELRDYLETSHESAQMMLGLVNDVLDISKLEAGKFALDEVSFSLRELLDDTIRTLSSRAYRKGLEIACRVSNKVPDALYGDPLRLRQILTNLVGNAIKFTDVGEVVVEVNLDVKSGRSCVLRFSVADSGIGISEEDQQRIFAPFTQADSSSTRRFAGTGLGLAIAGHLVNCFRGQFWVQSEVGVGSIFYFTARFPLADEQPLSTVKERPVLNSLCDVPVLVADDNDTNRSIISNVLKDWHMRPILAGDAESAIQQMKQADAQGEPIRLVMIDALMPERDGFDLAADISAAKMFQGKLIMMLSSADRIAFKERLQHLDVDAVLDKPISQSNLLDTIVSTLGVATVDQDSADLSLGTVPSKHVLDVLLVEDTPANRKVADRILSKRGHRVTTASNGREALDLFREQSFDVVLMDVQMPSMDGLQATEAIRTYEIEHEVSSHVPIVAMTAHALPGDRQRCLAAGMDDYVSKPISIRKVVQVVEKHGLATKGIADSGQFPAIGSSSAAGIDGSTHSEIRDEKMNLQNALQRLDGDEELLCDLIDFYLEDYPSLLSQIEQARSSADHQALQRAAHSLKGLLANFDAERCRELAEQIEQAARQRELAQISSAVTQLQKCTADLAGSLASYRESRRK